MSKTKTEKLLKKYAGVASAILAAQGLQAQIKHFQVDSTLSMNGDFYDFNIDQDTSGISEFRIVQSVDSSGTDISGVIIRKRGNASGQVMGLEVANYNYAYRLYLGENIGPGEQFEGINKGKNIGYLGLEIDGDTYPNSRWTNSNGIEGGILGIRFGAMQNDTMRTFYGWIRLDIAPDLKSCTIRDYAYNSIPDSSLEAGQLYIGEEELIVEKPEIQQRGKLIDVSLPSTFKPQATIVIYSLDGKKLHKEKFNAHEFSLNLEFLPKGIHVFAIESNHTKATKKIVVY